MNNVVKSLAGIILIVLTLVQCTSKSIYERMVEDGLASEIRQDSLFLDIKFGMPAKQFFIHCWDLNKKGLIMQGPANLSVEYQLDSLMQNPTYMRFYPNFKDNKIFDMPVEFICENYAPWNASTSADSLILDVKNLFEKWYGGEHFIPIFSKSGNQKIWVKVDANRRILLFNKNFNTVGALFSDLTQEPKASLELGQHK